MFGFRLNLGPFFFMHRIGGRHGRKQGPGVFTALLWLLFSPLILCWFVLLGMALATRWTYRLLTAHRA